jgi:hypothetical protein
MKTLEKLLSLLNGKAIMTALTVPPTIMKSDGRFQNRSMCPEANREPTIKVIPITHPIRPDLLNNFDNISPPKTVAPARKAIK